MQPVYLWIRGVGLATSSNHLALLPGDFVVVGQLTGKEVGDQSQGRTDVSGCSVPRTLAARAAASDGGG